MQRAEEAETFAVCAEYVVKYLPFAEEISDLPAVTVGTTASLEEALRSADEYVVSIGGCPDLMSRNAPWRSEPATEAQKARVAEIIYKRLGLKMDSD